MCDTLFSLWLFFCCGTQVRFHFLICIMHALTGILKNFVLGCVTKNHWKLHCAAGHNGCMLHLPVWAGSSRNICTAYMQQKVRGYSSLNLCVCNCASRDGLCAEELNYIQKRLHVVGDCLRRNGIDSMYVSGYNSSIRSFLMLLHFNCSFMGVIFADSIVLMQINGAQTDSLIVLTDWTNW